MSNELKIEAGKYYRLRNSERVYACADAMLERRKK